MTIFALKNGLQVTENCAIISVNGVTLLYADVGG